MPKSKINDEFLTALDNTEGALAELGFERDKYMEKGYAQYVYYKRLNTIVELLFGPSDWHVDVIIYISKNKFSFGELLSIPLIMEWVNNNRYKEENGRNLQNEVLWFVELLKVSLPIIKG